MDCRVKPGNDDSLLQVNVVIPDHLVPVRDFACQEGASRRG